MCVYGPLWYVVLITFFTLSTLLHHIHPFIFLCNFYLVQWNNWVGTKLILFRHQVELAECHLMGFFHLGWKSMKMLSMQVWCAPTSEHHITPFLPTYDHLTSWCFLMESKMNVWCIIFACYCDLQTGTWVVFYFCFFFLCGMAHLLQQF